MNNRSEPLLLIVVLSSLILLSGGSISSVVATSANPAAVEPIHIKVGTIPILSHVILQIAKKDGYFDREGLSVELIPLKSTRDFVALLLNGSLDVAQSALTPGFFNAVAAGGKVKMALPGTTLKVRGCSYVAFMVRRADMDRGIYQNPANWKGAKVALPPAGPQSTSGYLADLFLQQAGIGLGDVNLPVIDMAIQQEALRAGQVDVVVAGEPWVTRMKEDSQLAQLMPGEPFAPDLNLSAILYGAKILDNPDAGNRFAVAYLKAVHQYLQGATPRNTEIVTNMTGLDKETVKKICLPDIPADGITNTDSLIKYQQWLFKKTLLDRIVSPAEFLDTRFVDAAHRVLKGNGQ